MSVLPYHENFDEEVTFVLWECPDCKYPNFIDSVAEKRCKSCGFSENPGKKETKSGTTLEDQIAQSFKNQGYIVFTRRNHVDVLAIKPDMALGYVLECKDYSLSRKQQRLAVKELSRNYVHALELLLANRLYPEKILKVLVARAFTYQARGVLQYTPHEFINHVTGHEAPLDIDIVSLDREETS